MTYALPTSVDVDGVEYAIRSDYRAVLDILTALADPDLSEAEKAQCVIEIFYPDYEEITDYEAAIKACFDFISYGDDNSKKAPRLMDWEQDFNSIVGAVNRVVGTEIRSVEYMHWYTFLAAYYEIGDCLFAQIVNIRNKKAKGKRLEKYEQEWYRENRHLVDFRVKFSDADNEALASWGIK